MVFAFYSRDVMMDSACEIFLMTWSKLRVLAFYSGDVMMDMWGI